MNRQIRHLGIAMLVLFGALFVQLNVIQVIRADAYNDNPNNTRAIVRDFNEPRGQIVAADGTVLARSVPNEGRFERRREYPEGELFAEVTGYFSFVAGAAGAEKTYNDVLAGRTSESADDLGELLLGGDRTADVRLTLPSEVQRVARDALGATRGSVVALDPRDGSILALWNFPSYDPALLSSVDIEAAQAARDRLLADEANPLLPATYRETYFPGSTFKVVTAAAGLSSGQITAESPSYPTSTAYVPPLTTNPINNFGGSSCGGALFSILRVSCNTAFAQMGVDLGAEILVNQAEAFGFNQAPPLDLPEPEPSSIGEVASFVQNTPVLAMTAIGQNAVRATPLQMAMVAGGVANGGQVMVPHVMAEVRNDDGEVIDTYEPEPWTRAMSAEDATLLTEAMVGVVEDGTASRLAVPGVTTAGKTGTAQLGNGLSHAWIVGFAPAEAPRVAVAVIVEAQPGASEQTGGRVAAPIAQAVLSAALGVTP
ncbi:MAG TPA: penicillin-binding transpeptidase domain-containing protein [Acidimicrobiales bacterium]|nr:penicillin-binding transpeptidase domain-containing protein [Acidimicrobiales bacterium]